MKKFVLFVLVVSLVFAPLFAAPTEEEVGHTLEGVMMVYATTLMGSMFGASYEGAEIEMDMETGASSLVCDKLDVTRLFSADSGMGAMMAASGEEVPEILFTQISGSFKANEAGDFDIDVTLKDGPVKKLILIMKDEEAITFKADGKDFRYLTNNPDFTLFEE